MRALFLLLLLINLLFLAWTRWVVVPPAVVTSFSAGTQAGSTPIKLRQEVPADAATATASQAPSRADSAVEATCVSLGPFLEPAAVEKTAARLTQLGFVARQRSSVDEVRVGLWVRVPNLATPDDAANALASLQLAGLSDAYVVSDGSPGNTVSLGVFADRGRAEQVAATVRKAGFKPETSDRLRTMDVFWLDIDRQANGGLPTLDAVESNPAPDLPLEMRACPSSATAGADLPVASQESPAG